MIRPLLMVSALLAASATAGPTQRSVLTGFVDRTGQVVEPATWEAGSAFFEGDWVAVARGGKAGFLNLRTHESTGLRFDGTGEATDRPLFAHGPEPVLVGGRWGYADTHGTLIIPPRFTAAMGFDAAGIAAAQDTDAAGAHHWGLIDRSGAWVVPARYDGIRPFHAGLAVVRRGEHWGAIDQAGREVVAPTLAYLGNFAANGLAPASRTWSPGSPQRRFGYVDRTGRFTIPEQFESAGDFDPVRIDGGLAATAGLARVSLPSGDVAWIDATGRAVVRFPAGIVAWGVSPNGLVRFQERATARYGYADTAGRIVIPARFAQAGGFDATGLAPATEGTQAGYIQADGSWAFPPRFSLTGEFGAFGQAQAEENGQSVLIDRTGQVLARLTHGENFYWQNSRYAAFQLYPPQIDYPPQHFGAWTLERRLYAVPRVPSLWPTPIGEIRLSLRTGDGLRRWSLETEGWVLRAVATQGPEKEPDVFGQTELTALPTPDALLALWRRSMDAGGARVTVAVTPGTAPEQAEQRERLARLAAARAAHEATLTAAAADLPAALAAYGAAIADQYGRLSGKPCMPPQCVY